MEISDAERRAEEAEALAAIYGDDFVRADECVWEILVPTSSSSDATSAAYFAATGERESVAQSQAKTLAQSKAQEEKAIKARMAVIQAQMAARQHKENLA